MERFAYNRAVHDLPILRQGASEVLKGLGGATIWSANLDNLVPFYRDVLGLKVAYEVPGFVGFGERGDSGGYKGAYLGIGTHSEVKGIASDPYRHMVGLESDDVDADYERLTAAGLGVIEEATDYRRAPESTLHVP